MSKKILVFDSHPVQYRVPIWQKLHLLIGNALHVAYASDCSVIGHQDSGFGEKIKWDEPLLSGYGNTILSCESGIPLSSWKSLTGKGVSMIIDQVKPDYILLTGLNYKFDLVAYIEATKRKVPLWLRCETQDEATDRNIVKSIIRKIIYKFLYRGFDQFFYIGELNKKHYLNHGVDIKKLTPALYGTVNRYEDMPTELKEKIRNELRSKSEISNIDLVIGFSGKFIDKKNPDILFDFLERMPTDLLKKLVIYFVGSGPLEISLKLRANEILCKYGVKTIFTGFVNQTKIGEHYLAMDILILPSRKMGETWGLVANEALQAGCSVIVSQAVGCSANFKSLDRFEVIPVEDKDELADKIIRLSKFKREFDWARSFLESYSIESTVNSFSNKIKC